jgi:hypothetical protein
MPPPRTWRRSAWPIYPGILAQYTVAMIGYAAALSGFRLPLRIPLPVQAILELVVLYLVWKALKGTWAARKSILRLFNAQTKLSFALLLQAFILLLPH